ncbi:hypothetical protein BB559_003190 [Furculomyces boomerangus]|uniref:Uncharacterized protein n=1 Tax=Furculomyces boomerangus TaxID=61424 RepID=A0A2T9YN20_9FUNG|nr:hypothetical protein BB559_003190 [Furculomyces boomerangus]
MSNPNLKLLETEETLPSHITNPRDRDLIVCEICGKGVDYKDLDIKFRPLYGDCYYTFKCSECNNGEPYYKRSQISWVQAVHLIMYHLKVESPETKYFRWREHICAKFDEYWECLIPEKIRTPTWHNTVAGCISTHNALFKSGFEEINQTGFWALRAYVKPSKEGFKCPTKLKSLITDKNLKIKKKLDSKTDFQKDSPIDSELLVDTNTYIADTKNKFKKQKEFSSSLYDYYLSISGSKRSDFIDTEIEKILSSKVLSDESSLDDILSDQYSSDTSVDEWLSLKEKRTKT